MTDNVQASQLAAEKTSQSTIKGKASSSISPEMDKLKICKEDFEASKVSFQLVRIVILCVVPDCSAVLYRVVLCCIVCKGGF